MGVHADPRPLLGVSLVFTQDDLLYSDQFCREAKKWGIRLDDAGLRALHEGRRLLPMFRVDDDAIEGRRVAVPDFAGGVNARFEVLTAGRDGRIRDPALEGYSTAWPYTRPPSVSHDDARSRWWNGFTYATWQLIELDDLSTFVDLRILRAGGSRKVPRLRAPYSYAPFARARRRTVALCALATKYLPGVTGRASLPAGEAWTDLRRERVDRSASDLLTICGVAPSELYEMAESLLLKADSRDPMRDWLVLVRHMSSDWWFRLRGAPLASLWRRIAAEVLLRAHEDLAADGIISPLPTVGNTRWRQALHGRLGGEIADEEPLEDALSRSGLAPHPRLLLLVPGETELRHIRRVLRVLASDMPDFIRVQDLGGERTNPRLLARYVVAPRIRRATAHGYELAVPPTALFIATDPEQRFATEAKRQAVVQSLRKAIRADVERQDATITDEVLDLLVHVEVWGDACYELANFTDDEVIDAAMCVFGPSDAAEQASWRADLRADLTAAREGKQTLSAVLERRRIKKPDLADALWPTLEMKLEKEDAASGFTTSVLRVAAQAIDAASHIPRGSVWLEPKPSGPE